MDNFNKYKKKLLFEEKEISENSNDVLYPNEFKSYHTDYRFKNFNYNQFSLKDGVLFYPCSCYDVVSPILHFSSIINDFWFVDKYSYHPKHRYYGQNDYTIRCDYRFGGEKIDRVTSVFKLEPKLKLVFEKIDEKLWIPSLTKYDSKLKDRNWVDPLVFTEILKRKSDGKIITVNLKRGDAFATLTKKDIDKISIFFYRGDSGGEGGSGLEMFKSFNFKNILSKLVDGALIVTDGSNCHTDKLKVISEYNFTRLENIPSTPSTLEFDYFLKGGDRFRFIWIGNIDDRYGPTRVWQIRKNQSFSEKIC